MYHLKKKRRQLGGSSSILLAQANGIRNLRALVAAQSGDTHLRHDLPWKKTKVAQATQAPRNPHELQSRPFTVEGVFFVSLFTREPKKKLVCNFSISITFSQVEF